MSQLNLKSFLLLFSLLLLTACSQRFQDVNATMAEAMFGADDIELTSEKIATLPYASAYVRINDGPQIFMVLAFAEANPKTGVMQYKWMSSDRAMIITESGRVVKTIGLYGNNLANVARERKTAQAWKVTYDWMPKYRYGYQAIAIQSGQNDETLVTPLNTYTTEKHIETVTFDAIDARLVNVYWIDTKTNKVIKSIEYLGPEMAKIELTVLKVPTI